MTIWNNSKMAVLHYSKDAADEHWPCIVKLTDDSILVEYDDEGMVQYTGASKGDGHFALVAPEVKGRATLHRLPGENVLEGSWAEDGVRGMWKIDLA